ncbi:hypothetical protein NCS57_01060500 [Fusarium keratoplasticum]|uniref:Uncharacterized protein n=1 Tax=Fusarium keratoplasticum TaxID=1328300 RepID=A0ACC0QNH1_9HYPO|nr:hypothetical protein NCS57_01060500 [Fusarium keratoplasticum]KAI8660822.1 hypothetical protein NCS57_01060500 [Fusarium keratoplasticum]KAI8661850.1 hypothetical protein NCS55_01056300 [Fusarium keratoplasticum]
MGIKGIYQEIGEGRRVALAKLAADSLVNEGRPFRIAIDIAIWQFQSQVAQGGTNPAIRTLFYRLVRLLAAPIKPVFVFDGPYKPKIKRNKRSGRGDALSNAQAKRLIHLLGFPTHDAPGEAEAECALLQQHGIVDAVMSEDVDTLMFGCTKMLRQWSPQSKRQTCPTHVSLIDKEEMRLVDQGLDREGMVLVALMSGGDYDPVGIAGCGPKVAVEAAKGGFGKSLCRLKASDEEGIQAWKKSLVHELRTNESHFFKRRNKALVIPDTFPDFKILRYYTHPVVSPESSLDEIRDKIYQEREIQIEDLREFTREIFGWDYRIGAIKFIRVLSHAVLINKLLDTGYDDAGYIKGITGFRSHVMSDLVPEVRMQHIPLEIIPIDLSKEVDESITQGRTGLALNSDDDIDEAENIEETSGSKSKAKPFDPSERYGIWALEVLARRSVPEIVAEAELKHNARERALQKRKNTTTKSKSGIKTSGTTAKTGMPAGALDRYVQISKSQPAPVTTTKEDAGLARPMRPSPTRPQRRLRIPSPLEPSKHQPTSWTSGSPARQTNPWTLGSSQVMPRPQNPPPADEQEAIVITSSPVRPVDSPPPTPTPSPKPRARAQELPDTVRSILASDGSPKRVRNTARSSRLPKLSSSSQGSQPTKLKQTSMDLFTKRSNTDISNSQPSPPKLPPPRFKPSVQSKDVDPFDDDPFDSDSDGLVPLSELISRSPTSPAKHHQPPIPRERNASPSPAPARKKKLLIPRASDVGFFKEVEVDADERDERLARETAALNRRGIKASVVRVSDIGFIDLTQED